MVELRKESFFLDLFESDYVIGDKSMVSVSKHELTYEKNRYFHIDRLYLKNIVHGGEININKKNFKKILSEECFSYGISCVCLLLKNKYSQLIIVDYQTINHSTVINFQERFSFPKYKKHLILEKKM